MAGIAGGMARVSVIGRAGCGRRTVSRVLVAAGLDVVSADQGPDVVVYVFAETLKPEDLTALIAPPRPSVAVLNKADLAGFGGDGPVATAARHCQQLTHSITTPLLALAGLAAVAALDDVVLDAEALAALRILAAEPANLGSTDGFVAGTHRLPADVRARLLASLDLFGIALAVRAIRDGADVNGVRAALRRASAVDDLITTLGRYSAVGRYRRIVAGTDDQLGDDAVIAARMAAAIAVVEADGVQVDEAVTASALLRRAVAWQRYGRGPVSRLHQSCSADIVRGSLRLWEHAGGAPEPLGRRHRAPEPLGRRHRAPA